MMAVAMVGLISGSFDSSLDSFTFHKKGKVLCRN
jgi:hypothetical protein